MPRTPSPTGRRARRAGLVLALLVCVGSGIQQLPSSPVPTAGPRTTAADPVAAGERVAAPAQTALDELLGPGRAVVTASADYTSATDRTSTTYDPRRVATLDRASAQVSAGGTGYRSSVTNNGVSRTVTRTRSAPQIRRLTVSVVVDSSLRPAPRLVSIRRLVTASLGVRTARGDRLVVASAPMPAPRTPVAGGRPLVPAGFTPYLRSGAAGIVAILLLLALLVEAVRCGRSR